MAIFKSVKMWMLVLDAVVILAGYFVAKYAPQFSDDLKLVLVTIQPIVALIIGALFVNDKFKELARSITEFGQAVVSAVHARPR